MKSTGEVMGTDVTLEKGSIKPLKHLTSTCQPLVTSSLLFMTIPKKKPFDLARRSDAIGYGIYATEGTAKFLNEHGVHATLVNKLGETMTMTFQPLVRTGKAQAIINTVGNKRTL